ncbi:MAG: UvrD-helicase domain-containing protein [Alphaproteobacteria bacterium]|nr:UvrD-helicase domain-containing protein [Alphaproteobacteria bacterium]MDP6565192.1 UvrD-helicase domain-containing protein [Alphaproteobacteria bacterium]MDP6811983.1 UvrD-helicase domain-containing protein [Alphaproteobacteria bacterium]
MSDPFDLEQIDEAPGGDAPALLAPYVAELNPEQRQAVEALDGPLLVLAGAGTGKTRVLTTRLAHILHQRRAFPSQILAVTFTNKASREMRERIGGMIGRAVEGLWLGTFHAIGVRILRRHAELAGLKSNFTILDTDDQLRLLKQVIEAADLDAKRWPPRQLAAMIDRWKDRGLTPDKVPAGEGEGFGNGRGVELYAHYQERLRTLNACDFGDLLLHCLRIFADHADVLAAYQKQFRYILVDEYQDTNVAQYLLLRLLAQSHRNICCVGDDDQSIYSWRGAEVGNILRFEKDFPGARVIRLERNYRSTPQILAAASGLIAKNQGRLGKTLWTELDRGELISVRGVWDGAEEARVVGDEVEALQRDHQALNGIAILVRASFQTREFEERFLTLGLPYRLIGGPRFYERAEIRDAVAYLRVLAQPDDDLAFERIVNTPKRGLGNASLQAIHAVARGGGLPLGRAARTIVEGEDLKPRARNSLRRLLDDFDRWRGLMEAMPPAELTETVLEESGYTDMWQAAKTADAPGRLENLKELIHALEPFDKLQGFLEHVSLVMDAEMAQADDAINIMTLHGAKGLEFDTVFLPGWEEGLFPHQRALDEGGQAALEEERRLAYVGLTRARRRAIVSSAAQRRMYDRWVTALPSRFIAELPADQVTMQTEPGLYAGGVDDVAAPGAFAFDDGYTASDRMRRAQSAVPAPTYLEGQADSVITTDPASSSYAIGERVFHQKFGYGRIEDIEGNKLLIAFEKAGTKKVVDSFVDPA